MFHQRSSRAGSQQTLSSKYVLKIEKNRNVIAVALHILFLFSLLCPTISTTILLLLVVLVLVLLGLVVVLLLLVVLTYYY